MLQKLPPWKVPGKNGLQGYWIKAFKSLHDQLLNFLNLCLQSGKIPTEWSGERLYLFSKILSKVLFQAIINPLHVENINRNNF